MTQTTIYKYVQIKPNGKKRTIISMTINPSYGDTYETMCRLVADAGKVLTDGRLEVPSVDTTTPEVWSEIDAPEIDDE